MLYRPQKYQEAKSISIDEALGIDSMSDPGLVKKIGDSFSISDFLDGYRGACELLEAIDENLEDIVLEYERDPAEREMVEAAYSCRISILYDMARRFHPLSRFGQKKLKEARKCRMEYETLVGPLVTAITDVNADLFSKSMSEDVLEDVRCGRRMAIGTISTKDGESYASAALVYHIEASPFYEKGVLSLDWLYVHEDFRGRGLAHLLIGELFESMVEAGISNMIIAFPAKGETAKAFGYIFSEWHFDLDTAFSPDTIIRIGDVSDYEKISSLAAGAKGMAELSKKDRERIADKMLGYSGYRGFLLDKKTLGSYIDWERSCYVGSEALPKGLLLAHRTPSGIMRAEYIGAMQGADSCIDSLTCRFLEQVVNTCEDDTLVSISPVSEEQEELLGVISPKQLSMHRVQGIVMAPATEEDIDEDGVEALLAASEDIIAEARSTFK